MATQSDFSEFSGNDIDLKVVVIDEATNEPLNLTGAQALVWALGKRAKASLALVTKTLENAGVEITNALEGMVTVHLAAADTEALKAGDYYHEMRLVNVAGKRATLMYGTATIQENLIRN